MNGHPVYGSENPIAPRRPVTLVRTPYIKHQLLGSNLMIAQYLINAMYKEYSGSVPESAPSQAGRIIHRIYTSSRTPDAGCGRHHTSRELITSRVLSGGFATTLEFS